MHLYHPYTMNPTHGTLTKNIATMSGTNERPYSQHDKSKPLNEPTPAQLDWLIYKYL